MFCLLHYSIIPSLTFQLCFVSESQQLICQFLINLLEKVIGTLKQAHSFILAIFSWHAPKIAYQSQHYCPPESPQDTTGFSGNHIYMHTSSFILYLRILRSRHEDTRNSGVTCRYPANDIARTITCIPLVPSSTSDLQHLCMKSRLTPVAWFKCTCRGLCSL